MNKQLGRGYVPAGQLTLNPKALPFIPKKDACYTQIHDDCCVPHYGRMILAQKWKADVPVQAFTIHGLWPGNCLTGFSPEKGCEGQRYYSLRDPVLSDPALYDEMQESWPSPDGVFWAAQWNKHGTCLSTVHRKCYGNDESPKDALRYFRVTLATYKEFSILPKLLQEGIFPGASYSLSRFHAALADWRGRFSLHCSGHRLDEVRIYLLGMANDKFSLHLQWVNDKCPSVVEFPAKPAQTPTHQGSHYFVHDEH